MTDCHIVSKKICATVKRRFENSGLPREFIEPDLKMSTWRSAGLNYVNYSNIAARVLRKSLKGDLRDDAAKRDASHIKMYYWAGGEILPAGQKPPADKDKPG